MRTVHVTVVPYDSKWPQEFQRIVNSLPLVIGSDCERIEHVGSTSVLGLCAKPVIDSDVVLKRKEDMKAVSAKLADAGYIDEGDLGIEGREAFRYEGKPELMSHHLYVCGPDSRELHRHLAFRDYLRKHPDAVREYSDIKKQAASLYPDDIDGYIAYKSAFIEKIYHICLQEE